jgi:hypothetical protein
MNRGSDYPSVPSDLEEIWKVDRPRVLRISNVGMIIILPFEGEAGERSSTTTRKRGSRPRRPLRFGNALAPGGIA